MTEDEGICNLCGEDLEKLTKGGIFIGYDFKSHKCKIKHPEHDSLVNDFDQKKSKHLEKLATKMLKRQDKLDALKNKKINKGFLDLF